MSKRINVAARHLGKTEGKANLRECLKAEALANAERDLAIAVEWFPVDEEGWRTLEKSAKLRRVVKSRQT